MHAFTNENALVGMRPSSEVVLFRLSHTFVLQQRQKSVTVNSESLVTSRPKLGKGFIQVKR